MLQHRKNGWLLVEYDWDPTTGLATFVYERRREDFDAVEEKRVVRPQPAGPGHTGWGAWLTS